MNEDRQADVSWLREMNSRAEGYAQMRLRTELWAQRDFRGISKVKSGFALNVLKLYYVFSAPVVTIVARSDRLMSLARMLNAPTKHVVRKILG
ncbi:MAG: hypothetical protein ABSF00_12925 [Candidatus Bathyarchaeia archaeon]